ncbi:MAG: integrase/recombinase XerD [Saprospiraceae bacterium]|jgi:integrase/recombinase XerD
MRQNCTIKFYLHDRIRAKRKGFPIYGRITYQRKKAHFASAEYCKPENWNKEVGLPKNDHQTKQYLIQLEGRVYEIKNQLDIEKKDITAVILRDILRNGFASREKEKIKLLDYLDRHIERISKLTQDYTTSTISHYNTTRLHLSNFLQSRKLENINLEDFNLELVTDFDEFFMTTISPQTGQPIRRNTANKYHTKLKTALLGAYKKRHIKENPYAEFPLKNQKVHRVYLTMEELDKVMNLDLVGNKSLERARDIFLWTCYTGMRYSDTQKLTADKIEIDKNGQYWIAFRQTKTDQPLTMPLLDGAVKIYEKYKFQHEISGKVLPQLSNNKENTYIKVIINLAGINKHITHHIGRHTFATTILLENDVPIEVVKEFLGHDSLKSTMIYAKITRDKKMGIINKLNLKNKIDYNKKE